MQLNSTTHSWKQRREKTTQKPWAVLQIENRNKYMYTKTLQLSQAPHLHMHFSSVKTNEIKTSIPIKEIYYNQNVDSIFN